MKFRKKYSTVDAFQSLGGESKIPDWATELIEKGRIVQRSSFFYIETSIGLQIASIGDYIIKDAVGDVSCLAPEVFWRLYEDIPASTLSPLEQSWKNLCELLGA